LLSRVSLALRYVWAAPATLAGIALAFPVCACGARVRVRNGVIEVAGGLLARFAQSSFGVSAITFGHVVLGVSHSVLARERAHEQAHVRQYERWGVLFFPLYLASSFFQWARGRNPYLDNAFEKQAVRVAAGPVNPIGQKP
jgi:hypothetical protein